jgi:hypothetical protein
VPALKTSTPRVHEFRERKRSGQACYRIIFDEVRLEELLVESGTLAEADRDDRAAVEAALTRFVELSVIDFETRFKVG